MTPTSPLPPSGFNLQLLPLPLLGLDSHFLPYCWPSQFGQCLGSPETQIFPGTSPALLRLGVEGSPGVNLLQSCPSRLSLLCLPPSRLNSLICLQSHSSRTLSAPSLSLSLASVLFTPPQPSLQISSTFQPSKMHSCSLALTQPCAWRG